MRAERERRIAEEQGLIAEDVLREHNEAAAALAAELARLRASYGAGSYTEASAAAGGAAAALALGALAAAGAADERAAEAAAWLRRCEWREARMALAARRRMLLQAIEAEELVQLRAIVAAAQDARAVPPPAVPDDVPGGPRPGPVSEPGGGIAAGSGVEAVQAGAAITGTDCKAAAQVTSPSRPEAAQGNVPADLSGAMTAAAAPAAEGDGAAADSMDVDMMDVDDGPPDEPGHGGHGDAAAVAAGSVPPISASSSAAAAAGGAQAGGPLAAAVGEAGEPRSPDAGAQGRSAAAQERELRSPLPLTLPALALAATPGLQRPRRRPGASMPGAPLTPPGASRGGAAPGPGPGLADVGHRPVLHAGAKRRLSVTGAGAFAPAGGASGGPWDLRPTTGSRSLLSPGPSGSWAVGGGGGGGGWGQRPASAGGQRPISAGGASERPSRPPSPGGGGMQMRGSMPSRSLTSRATLGRSSGGGGTFGGGAGGAGGGLLLQLQSRTSRRRWTMEDGTSGSSGGGGGEVPYGVHGPFGGAGGAGVAGGILGGLPSPGIAWDGSELALRQHPGSPVSSVHGGGESSGGGGGRPSTGGGRAAALRWQQQVVRQQETAVRRLASADVRTGGLAVPPLDHHRPDSDGDHAEGDADMVPHVGGGARRRRALWKLPPPGASDAGGTAWGVGPDAAALAAVSPVTALLRDFKREPRIGAVPSAAAAVTAAAHLYLASGDGDGGDGGVMLSEDLAYAPVGVAVQTCLYGTVLSQYRLTTRAVWHVLVHECGLLQFCAALRRFFFCEAGDVAGCLAHGLTRRLDARPHVPPSSAELRALLDEALAGSSLWPLAPGRRGGTSGAGAGGVVDVAGSQPGGVRRYGSDAEASVAHLLAVRAAPGRRLGAGGYFGSDVMLVTCQVPAPLDSVISPTSLATYSDVLSLLLRVRCASAVLASCWGSLNAASSPLGAAQLGRHPTAGRRAGGAAGGRAGAGRGEEGPGQGSGVHTLWAQRLALARLWLQVELQGRCWAGLAAALGGSAPLDLTQLRRAHERYLADARQVCMLPSARPHAARPEAGSAAALGPELGSGPEAPAAPPLGAALTNALQSCHALASVLRRALAALEVQAGRPEGLSAAPRQGTLSPALPSVSRGVQSAATGGGNGGGVGGSGGAERGSGASPPGRVAAVDLDEVWTHVVACQVRLGRALGVLHGELRAARLSSGPLGELACVLASEPCRAYAAAAGSVRAG
ncbi:hypothetical protein GPECTOR_17g955 [Gonium pectorale]|uniref:Gamma tubulin complex component C-terminal domain-containing protein n=1 Tax=Gonium pectorale TaxID=33097 RepID=A0A150GKE5_GONPE|nr:hypothetical protein GPECTOR_17g955 [Gonium pectorale]|eukprot:KXZ50316.1 hypothetical protein GPECTOR_17g955 [Gonium pectorale]